MIIPSIIAKNQKEFNERYSKVKSATNLHLDLMDGKFVKNKSLLNIKLPKHKYQMHFMTNNPKLYAKKYLKSYHTAIIHVETIKDNELLKELKKQKKKVYLAINPKTSINKIKPYIKDIKGVLVMTVNPGKYGAKFLPTTLKKITQLRIMKPSLVIEVDGSMNPKTIKKARKAGADAFSVGSYLQNSTNLKKAIKELK